MKSKKDMYSLRDVLFVYACRWYCFKYM